MLFRSEVPETVKTEIAPTTNVSAMTIYMDDARSVEAIDLVSPSERKKFHWVPKTARGAEGGETAKTQDTAKTQNVADDAENSPVASPEFGSAELDVSRIVENLKRELDFIPADSLERHTAIMKYHQESDTREKVDWVGFDMSVTRSFQDDMTGALRLYQYAGASSIAELVNAICNDPKESLKRMTIRGSGEGTTVWEVIGMNSDFSQYKWGDLEPSYWNDNRGKEFGRIWAAASRIVNRNCRHHNHRCAVNFHEGGWVRVSEILSLLDNELMRSFPHLPAHRREFFVSSNWLLGVTSSDSKGRFQVAIRATRRKPRRVTSVEFIRVTSGHSDSVCKKINSESILYSPIQSGHEEHISCFTHKTRFQNLLSIFQYGLQPGKNLREYHIRSGFDRGHTNLSAYDPFDPRNTAGGRMSSSYDAIIMLAKAQMISDHNLLLSMNGVVVTLDTIAPKYFRVIYVIPGGDIRDKYVLYREDLVGKEIKAVTNVKNGAEKPQKREPTATRTIMYGTRLWRDCPWCTNTNPDGFTCCTWCHAQFIFEEVSSSSRRRGRDEGQKAGNDSTRGSQKTDGPNLALSGRDMIMFAKKARKESLRLDKMEEVRSNPKSLQGVSDAHLWKHVKNLLDWRYKWDHQFDDDRKLKSVREGGGRWTSGRHFKPDARASLDKKLDDAQFHKDNYEYFVESNHPDPATRLFKLKIFSVAYICDLIEQNYKHYLDDVPNFIRWVDWPKSTVEREFSNSVCEIYYSTLTDICDTFEVTMVDLASKDLDTKAKNSRKWAACGQKAQKGGMTEDTKAEVVGYVDRLPASDRARAAASSRAGKPDDSTTPILYAEEDDNLWAPTEQDGQDSASSRHSDRKSHPLRQSSAHSRGRSKKAKTGQGHAENREAHPRGTTADFRMLDPEHRRRLKESNSDSGSGYYDDRGLWRLNRTSDPTNRGTDRESEGSTFKSLTSRDSHDSSHDRSARAHPYPGDKWRQSRSAGSSHEPVRNKYPWQ